jgi:hypothetical protein
MIFQHEMQRDAAMKSAGLNVGFGGIRGFRFIEQANTSNQNGYGRKPSANSTPKPFPGPDWAIE